MPQPWNKLSHGHILSFCPSGLCLYGHSVVVVAKGKLPPTNCRVSCGSDTAKAMVGNIALMAKMVVTLLS